MYQFSMKTSRRKPVVDTAVSYFTKLRIQWDDEGTGRPRILPAIDDSIMKSCFFGLLATF